MAPPWEKPASTIFRVEIPFLVCSLTSSSTAAWEARIPTSSSAPPPSSKMSYQARMRMPWLSVTGRTGACGNTKRRASEAGSRSSGTIGSKSWPSAPRPCSQMTAAEGDGPVASSMDSMTWLFLPDRRFRPEGLDERLARLDVRAADEIDAIRHGGENAGRIGQALQSLANGFRLSGEVDDERLAANHRHLAGEDRRRHETQ